MKALFFGSAGRQLFGAYHPVDDEQVARDTGVVVCPPWLNEYNTTHRALKNLANLLAGVGLPALRFDYYGTGDSAGETGSASPRDNAADVVTATRELTELAGTRKVAIVGRGMGALAALYAAEQVPVESIVLWEPVVRGDRYLDHLLSLDRRQRVIRMQQSRRREPQTLLGYSVPDTVLDAIGAVDARGLQPSVRGRCLIVAREQTLEHRELIDALRGREVVCDHRIIDDERQPEDVRAADTALLASRPLQAIVHWLKEQP